MIPMPATYRASSRIESVVTGWPGVTARPHRFGGREYRVGPQSAGTGTEDERTTVGREFGHTHGETQADVPFPRALRDVLVRDGRTSEHHLYPESGWVSFYVGEDGDGDGAVALLRLSYLWHVASLQRRPGVDPALAEIDVAAGLAALGFGPDVDRVFERVLG